MEQPSRRTSWLYLARDGWIFLTPPLVVGVIALAFGWSIIGWIGLGAAGFVGFFFRDPERPIPQAVGCVVSPADGRVVSVGKSDGCPELGGEVQTVKIFLSLFDVHINRAPCGGDVQRTEYTPGKFLPAFRGEASQSNERNSILFNAGGTPIVVRQIAGLLARRIVCWVGPGDSLERGQRIGLIRFGSRVEVDLPASATLLVQEGAKVKGGSTIIARLAPEEAARAT
ncbi:MAG: phosphatidylserine decarboxylase [Nitrospinae bacterium]|nr:phosphatidylserine decarboxylase [Nitrospinota bacterium]